MPVGRQFCGRVLPSTTWGGTPNPHEVDKRFGTQTDATDETAGRSASGKAVEWSSFRVN